MRRKLSRSRWGQPATVIVLCGLLFTAGVMVTQQSQQLVAKESLSLLAPRSIQGQYTLLLHSQSPVVASNGGSTTITVQVRDVLGQPVAGASVAFSTQIGSISNPSVTTDAEGSASTVFTGAQSGLAIIQAVVGDTTEITYVEVRDKSATLDIPIVTIQLGATSLRANQSTEVAILVKDSTGKPFGNVPVTLFGSLGTIETASLMTDDLGRVATKFTAGMAGGQATITALAGYASGKAQFQVIGSSIATSTPISNADSVYLPLVAR